MLCTQKTGAHHLARQSIWIVCMRLAFECIWFWQLLNQHSSLPLRLLTVYTTAHQKLHAHCQMSWMLYSFFGRWQQILLEMSFKHAKHDTRYCNASSFTWHHLAVIPYHHFNSFNIEYNSSSHQSCMRRPCYCWQKLFARSRHQKLLLQVGTLYLALPLST